jgi:hypothetical protein
MPGGVESLPTSGLASPNVSDIALFAYGSLVDPASAAITLGHDVDHAPARLRGWRRRWSQARDNLASEKTFARVDDGALPPFCLGLNVERADGDEPGPNGSLLVVTADDLERLDLREIRYDRLEVTGSIEGSEGGLTVVTYVAKAANFAPEPPAGAVILASYLRVVEAAFDALGEGELDRFRETTGPPPTEVVEVELVRDAIPPGNPRAW